LALLALCSGMPALADGGAGERGAVIVQVDFQAPMISTNFFADGSGNYSFSAARSDFFIGASFSLTGNADPHYSYSLRITNLFTEELNITGQIGIRIAGISGMPPLDSTLKVTVIDNNANGATLSPLIFGPRLQSFAMSEDDTNNTFIPEMFLGGPTLIEGIYDYSTGEVTGPAPDPARGPEWIVMGNFLRFSLTPGDTVQLEGTINADAAPEQTKLRIERLEDSMVRVTWEGGGTLETSNDPADINSWSEVPGAVNPYETSISAGASAVFYRLRL
jgi:hypothetical protein